MNNSKERQLKKHKALATGLFFLMAVVYAAMVYFEHQDSKVWMGFVKSFSEAGMVGALADWFAVTALFRHPLGLPIPHTNLIERKKNDLGENLGKFVKDNFVNPENIRPYIEKLDVVKFVSDWLGKPNNQEVLEEETVNFIKKIIQDLDDEDVESFLTQQGEDILKTIDYQKISSSGVHYLIEKNEHINILEAILPQIKEYIHESQGMIREKISENRPFIAFLAGKKISKELTDGFIKFIEEIQADENHFVRIKLTEALQNFENELKTSGKWTNKFEQLKEELISEKNLQPYAKDAWSSIKTLLIESLNNDNSQLKNYLKRSIQKLSYNLAHDEELADRINRWIRHFSYRMILKNRNEAEALISSTVSSWEGRELSNKLELEVGKDLQFIRVNGTLVGGLVGLIIHTVTYFFIS